MRARRSCWKEKLSCAGSGLQRWPPLPEPTTPTLDPATAQPCRLCFESTTVRPYHTSGDSSVLSGARRRLRPGTAGAEAGPRAQFHASLEQGNCPSSPPTRAEQRRGPLSTGAGASSPSLPWCPAVRLDTSTHFISRGLSPGPGKGHGEACSGSQDTGPRVTYRKRRGRAAPGALRLPGPGAPGEVSRPPGMGGPPEAVITALCGLANPSCFMQSLIKVCSLPLRLLFPSTSP